MPKFKTLDDLPADLTGEVALVRVDLNLPMKDGSATDVTRAEAVKPTILELAGRGAKVLLLAHFGRPGGQRSSMLSTSMVIGDVEKVVGKEIMFIPELTGPVVAASARSRHVRRPAESVTLAALPWEGCARLGGGGAVRSRSLVSKSRCTNGPSPLKNAWRTTSGVIAPSGIAAASR